MKPFIHNVSFNVWQVCYVNEDNYLCAKTYKGRHAEQFAREDLERYMDELESENEKLKRHKRELQGGQQDLTKRKELKNE